MNIRSLGYVGVNATDVDTWRHFGGELLGMQVVERGRKGALALRLDDRCQRILIEPNCSNGGAFYGFEVDSSEALHAAANMLRTHDVEVHAGSADECAHRGVDCMLHFTDPLGTRLELFHGLAAADEPFAPARACGGFRTGELGVGHAVFSVPSIEAVLPFYTDVLGLRISDYADEPFRAIFLHANSRHHSIALIEAERTGLHHLMVEVRELDDVGQAYDRIQLHDGMIGATLGRHTNDYMLSFYAWSPSHFLVEYGWGGRSIDDATWQPHRLDHGPSLWGHERSWLKGPLRERARQMRLAAADAGERAPLQVAPDAVEFHPPREADCENDGERCER